MPPLNRRSILTGSGLANHRLREAAGYSQEGFAKEIGVHRTFMSVLERGRTNSSLLTLAQVADGLGVTLAELATEIEKSTRATTRRRK